MKTCLCNFDPLKLHFYIAKLRFTGVYIIFLISDLCFEQKYERYQNFLSEIFHFYFVVNFSVYLNRLDFVMYLTWVGMLVQNQTMNNKQCIS